MTEKKDKDVQSVYEMLNRNHSPLREQLLERLPQRAPGQRSRLRRIGEIIMKSNWTKLAAAAVVVLAVGIGAFVLLDGAATQAYALEQTLEANNHLRYLHFRSGPPGKGAEEAWVVFDDQGQLLNLITFMIFGAVFVGPAFDQVTWRIVIYAILSLTLIRMIPVWLSLVGGGYMADTKPFVGWFGPRGLASIIFGLLVLEETALTKENEIFALVAWTVLISVFAHGFTAEPLSQWFGRRSESLAQTEAPEMESVRDIPVRRTPSRNNGIAR